MGMATVFAHSALVLLSLGLWSGVVISAPTSPTTSSPPVTSQTISASSSSSLLANVTQNSSSSCFSPVSTSKSWFDSAGDWENPCSPSASSSSSSTSSSGSELSGLSVDQETLALWQQFFSSVSAESVAMDTVATLEEGADLADDLRQKILEEYLDNLDSVAAVLDNKTLIAGARDDGAAENTTVQEVQTQYRRLSLVMAYLEQCRHDQRQCDRNRAGNGTAALRRVYQALSAKVLQALCKLKGLFGTSSHPSFPAAPPQVPRSTMPAGHRLTLDTTDVYGGGDVRERARHHRDYVVAADVSRLLVSAAVALNRSDWSAV